MITMLNSYEKSIFFLPARAEVRRSPRDFGFLNFAASIRSKAPFFPPLPQPVVRIRFIVGVLVHGKLEDLLHFAIDLALLGGRDPIDNGGGMDPGLKADLVGVQVANARQVGLVEQETFDGTFFTFHLTQQFSLADALGVFSQADFRQVLIEAFDVADLGELAGAIEAEREAVIKEEGKSFVSRPVFFFGVVFQVAGHAEVE